MIQCAAAEESATSVHEDSAPGAGVLQDITQNSGPTPRLDRARGVCVWGQP